MLLVCHTITAVCDKYSRKAERFEGKFLINMGTQKLGPTQTAFQ
jgi:hypothetical protein